MSKPLGKPDRIVVALGGNALGNNPVEQIEAVSNTAHALLGLIEQGNEIIITHGNGRQRRLPRQSGYCRPHSPRRRKAAPGG